MYVPDSPYGPCGPWIQSNTELGECIHIPDSPYGLCGHKTMSPYGLCGHKTMLNLESASISLIDLTVSVDTRQ